MSAFTVAAVAPEGWQRILTVLLIVLVGVAAPFVYGAAHRWWRIALLIVLGVVLAVAGAIALWPSPVGSNEGPLPSTASTPTAEASVRPTKHAPSPSPTLVSDGETRVLWSGTLALAENGSWFEKKSGLRIAATYISPSTASLSISTDKIACDASPEVGQSIVMAPTERNVDGEYDYDRWYRVVVIGRQPPTAAQPEKVVVEWSVGTGEKPVASAFDGACW